MELHRPADADAFLELAGGFLAEREAEHNLILGLVGRLRNNPLYYREPPYFGAVAEGDRIVAAALRTPPHNLILSEVDVQAAVDTIADDVYASYDRLPGVIGPKNVAARFAALWEARSGQRGRLAIEERIHRADEARRPTGVPGRSRAYTAADHAVALRWLDEFATEALPEGGPRIEPEEWLAGWLDERDDGGLVIWDNAGAVSFTGFGSPTPNGIRVGPVYTPPEHRRRGYATALVADVTGSLLECGHRYCFLSTDLANPTSNAIYERIGYRPVSDVGRWAF